MMRDSSPPAAERPGLQDVAEEEDVFAAEGSSKSTLELRGCKVSVRRGVYFSVLP